MKTLLTLILLFTTTAGFSQSQDYAVKETTEGIGFSYKWAPSKWGKKSSQQMLCLRLVNTHSNAVQVTFSVGFYYQGLEQENFNVEAPICLDANEIIEGRKKFLCWISESLNNEQLSNEDEFDWEIRDVKVTQLETPCP